MSNFIPSLRRLGPRTLRCRRRKISWTTFHQANGDFFAIKLTVIVFTILLLGQERSRGGGSAWECLLFAISSGDPEELLFMSCGSGWSLSWGKEGRGVRNGNGIILHRLQHKIIPTNLYSLGWRRWRDHLTRISRLSRSWPSFSGQSPAVPGNKLTEKQLIINDKTGSRWLLVAAPFGNVNTSNLLLHG